MTDGELAQGLQDMLLDVLCIFVRVVGVVVDDPRREIGAVDRIVNGNGNLKLRVIVDDSARDGSPHRLHRLSISVILGTINALPLTVRLSNVAAT